MFAPEKETSGRIFVLTLNRAIANPMLVLTYNFATALTETTTLNLCTLTTKLLLVSSFQNCELKQEPSTLTTELQQTYEFHGHGKNISSAAPEMGTFVLTLNRASALKVEGNE